MSLTDLVLNAELRDLATDRIVELLLLKAGKRPRSEPSTWIRVTEKLGVFALPYSAMRYVNTDKTSVGYLLLDERHNQWIINYDDSQAAKHQARVLVHEIAHWILREYDPLWLCDRPIVYYYEGPIPDEMHVIARAVEETIFSRESL